MSTQDTAFAIFDSAVVNQDIVQVEDFLVTLRKLLEDELEPGKGSS
jgi:hypothetical protein